MKKISGIIFTIIGAYGMFISWFLAVTGEIEEDDEISKLFSMVLIFIILLVIGIYNIHKDGNNN
ncbi:MAG: hypothetical protein V8T22_03700 [Oscillospiraceae bacterium]